MVNIDEMLIDITINVHLSLWDAFKLRLAGCKAEDIKSLKKAKESEVEE